MHLGRNKDLRGPQDFRLSLCLLLVRVGGDEPEHRSFCSRPTAVKLTREIKVCFPGESPQLQTDLQFWQKRSREVSHCRWEVADERGPRWLGYGDT